MVAGQRENGGQPSPGGRLLRFRHHRNIRKTPAPPKREGTTYPSLLARLLPSGNVKDTHRPVQVFPRGFPNTAGIPHELLLKHKTWPYVKGLGLHFPIPIHLLRQSRPHSRGGRARLDHRTSSEPPARSDTSPCGAPASLSIPSRRVCPIRAVAARVLLRSLSSPVIPSKAAGVAEEVARLLGSLTGTIVSGTPARAQNPRSCRTRSLWVPGAAAETGFTTGHVGRRRDGPNRR